MTMSIMKRMDSKMGSLCIIGVWIVLWVPVMEGWILLWSVFAYIGIDTILGFTCL